jgi:hypothetical protein
MTDEALELAERKAARDKLVEQYRGQFTTDLETYIRQQLPMGMSNEHYQAGTASMLTALTRVLASSTVAWGETYGIDRDTAMMAVRSQLNASFTEAYDALDAGLAPQGELN